MATDTMETATPLTLEQIVRANIVSSVSVKQELLANDRLCLQIAAAGATLAHALGSGHRAFLMGNGGSAADAQHIAAELVGRYRIERRGLPVLALNVNTSCLTAIGNDYSYDVVFSRQIEALASAGDIVIGISTSGNSCNVILAIEAARARGAWTIGLTGASGGKLLRATDSCICIPSQETPRIQEAHILVGHILSEVVERTLFDRGSFESV